MGRSTESCVYPMSPSRVKRELRRLNIHQKTAAELIGKSRAMVSMTLNAKAKSRPILERLTDLVRARQAGGPQDHM